jgi:hypothetical protein
MNRQGPIRIGDRLGPRGRAPRGAAATWRRNGDRDVGFAKIDLQLPTHDKIMRAGPDGPALLGWQTAAIIFGELYLTDGVIRRSQLPALLPGAGPPDEPTIRRLVELHLWDELAPDAWRVHDFDKHNKSREERLADAKAAAESNAARQRRFRRRKKHKDKQLESVTERNDRHAPSNDPLLSGVTPLRSDQINSTQTNSEERRSTPPTPPSPGAPEPIGSDRSSLSLVKNPDSQEEPMPHPWDASSARMKAKMEHLEAVGRNHDPTGCPLCTKLAEEFASATEPRTGYLSDANREYLRRCREDLLRQRAAEAAQAVDEPAP